jgi:hypothetical protein
MATFRKASQDADATYEAKKTELENQMENVRAEREDTRGKAAQYVKEAEGTRPLQYEPRNEKQEEDVEYGLERDVLRAVKLTRWEELLQEHLELMRQYMALQQPSNNSCMQTERIPMASFEEESPGTEPYSNPVFQTTAGIVPPPSALPPDVPETCRPGPEVLEDLSATVAAPEADSVVSRLSLKTVMPPEKIAHPNESEEATALAADNPSGGHDRGNYDLTNAPGAGENMGNLHLTNGDIGQATLPAFALHVAALGPRYLPRASFTKWRYQSAGKSFL